MRETADAFAFEELNAGPRVRPGMQRAQARSIVQAAESEAARIRAEAREEGFREGLAAGRAEALEALQPAVTVIGEAVEQVRATAADMADRVEAEACALALAAAERIVAGTIELQPERVLDVVRGALRALVERERIAIHVNPADLELVRGELAELTALGGIEHIDVQEERRVARGGAIVRTNVGEIDARVEAKLERLRSALASAYAS